MNDYRKLLKKRVPKFYEWARYYRKPLLFWYVHNRNQLNKGVQELYYFKQIGQYLMAGAVILKLFMDPDASIYVFVLIATGILFVATSWIIGKGWDKVNGYEIESAWGNARNTLTKDLRKHFDMKNEDEMQLKKGENNDKKETKKGSSSK